MGLRWYTFHPFHFIAECAGYTVLLPSKQTKSCSKTLLNCERCTMQTSYLKNHQIIGHCTKKKQKFRYAKIYLYRLHQFSSCLESLLVSSFVGYLPFCTALPVFCSTIVSLASAFVKQIRSDHNLSSLQKPRSSGSLANLWGKHQFWDIAFQINVHIFTIMGSASAWWLVVCLLRAILS